MKSTTFPMFDGRGYEIRTAGPADAAAITSQRQRVSVENGRKSDADLAAMSAAFTAWVGRRLRDASYVGWLAGFDGRIVAGIGYFLLDRPPHPSHFDPVRGYIMNAYAEPLHRGTGISERLAQIATEHARNVPAGYRAFPAPFEALRQQRFAFAGVAEVPRVAPVFDPGAGISQQAAHDAAAPSPG